MNDMKIRRYGSGNSFKRIYLVAPRHPENFWSMQGTAALLGARTLMPNAALPTLMALTPPGINVEYALCDENISDLDWNMPCDMVVITGTTLHKKRIHELCDGFRNNGVKVALGGAYASINHDQCSHLADYHFIGEAEYTWPVFLQQWTKECARPVYHQKTYVDLKDSPAPDWSLIDVNDYININVQTSRGCPNHCEFCDVIQYVGKKPRTKSAEQVMLEVRNAHALGARTVFFSDDNFLANKVFTEKLLGAIIAWNKVQTRPLSFSTQITVEIADDEKLLQMCADARFSVLFLGVETVRRESLEEVKKYHNLKFDIFERVNRISRYGIMPFLGMIVGFDHDDESVFAEIEDFITCTSSPIAGISLLNAPRNTPLYKRLEKENRLIGDDFSGEWQLNTNIIPKQLSREVLLKHYCELFKKIYDPERFHARLLGWLRQMEYHSDLYSHKKFDPKQFFQGVRMIRYFLFRAKPPERKIFFKTLIETGKTNPRLLRRAFSFLAQYHHFYDFVHTKLPERI
jgi:radical SAM superfamily enzyme YgiQ (UPF0313 family)